MVEQAPPITILGAGASGLMAAVAASRVCPRGVLILEKEARVGRKLLATGNGRCNLMNMRLPRTAYAGTGAHIARALLEARPPAHLIEVFAALGLTCREEAEGRVYPFSGQASAVLDVLRAACERQGVQIRTETAAEAIEGAGDGFLIRTGEGRALRTRRLIVAGGGNATPSLGADGNAYALLAALGHTASALYPAITPLKVPKESIRGLKGVRVQATVALLADGRTVQREAGEILFADNSISGIAAMQLARQANMALAAGRQTELSIALMPPEMAAKEIETRTALWAGDSAERLFTGLLHSRISLCLLRAAGIPPQAAVAPAVTAQLLPHLSDWRVPVVGTLPFDNAQATAGGILLDAFDPETLASYLAPGLYACGEVLDVDGACGGYNLMWAWVSGLVAGTAAAASLPS